MRNLSTSIVMGKEKRSQAHRRLKIYCGVSAILLIAVLAVLVILCLTLFRPHDPKVTPQPVSLAHFKLEFFPQLMLNASLELTVTIDNRNYGSFKYKNSTAYVSYRGNIVAEAQIKDDLIRARTKHNISTTVNIFPEKLPLTDPIFREDVFGSRILNLTSSTTVHGKVSLFKILKMKATSYCTCDVAIFLQAPSIDSVCKSRIRL